MSKNLSNSKFLICALVCILFKTQTLLSQNTAFQWAKGFGCVNESALGRSVLTDQSGNVYTLGEFGGTVDFDPGAGVSNLTETGSNDIFISKLNSAGNFVWAKQIGSSDLDVALGFTIDASGNVLVAGNFKGTIDLDPGPGTQTATSSGDYDIFIMKLDPQGNLIWVKTLGGSTFDFAYSLCTDGAGNIYVGGEFQGTVDLDPGASTFTLSSTPNESSFVLKLNSSGAFDWARQIGGGAGSAPKVAMEGSTNLFIAGLFNNTADFDPGSGTFTLSSNGSADLFIEKLDLLGNFIWAKQIGGISQDFLYSVASDTQGNLCLTGLFFGTVDFDPNAGVANLTYTATQAAFYLKIDNAGNYVWAHMLAAPMQNYAYGIATDASNNVYITGQYQQTPDFDPGTGTYTLTAVSAFDMFILKLNSSGNFIWVKSIGGAGTSSGQQISVDAGYNIYCTGYFESLTDFDPDATTSNLSAIGNSDCFVSKIAQPTTTGLTSLIDNDMFDMFPNPANDLLTFDFSRVQAINVSIYNAKGILVYSSITETAMLKIDISDLEPGIYVSMVKDGNGNMRSKKFIKTHS